MGNLILNITRIYLDLSIFIYCNSMFNKHIYLFRKKKIYLLIILNLKYNKEDT